jgi:hypothetical protein
MVRVMNEFANIHDLLEEVEQDITRKMGSASRYPVRIILLDDFYYYIQILESINVQRIDLSDLMNDPEDWFGINKLCDIVSETASSAVIYPLSEILRFYSVEKTNSFFDTVLLKQNVGNNRIYIPLVGFNERFNNYWNNFNRRSEGPPVWSLKTPLEERKIITVYLCNSDIETSVSTLSTNQDWLRYWKTDRNSPIITKTQSLKHRWKEFLPNGCFNKDQLENSKDVLQKIYNLDLKAPYLDSECDLWDKLLNDYESSSNVQGSFATQVLENFANMTLGPMSNKIQVLKQFLNSDIYHRWLFKQLILQISADERSMDYLLLVISNLEAYTEYYLIKQLYYQIMELDGDKYISERKEIIEYLPKEYHQIVNSFISEFLSSFDEELRKNLELLTNYSSGEVGFLIKELAFNDRLGDLGNYNRAFHAYRDWKENTLYGLSISREILTYFDEYTKVKLINKRSEEYNNIFNRFNGNQENFFHWYYSLNMASIKEGTRLIQIDGVGSEWIPYIVYVVKKHGLKYNKQIADIEICRANVPTITKLNKLVDGNDFIQDFDHKIIHKSTGYNYPYTLIEQLELIEVLVKDFILSCPEDDIYITSDHGCTCLCQKQFDCISIEKNPDAEHEGRYLNQSNRIANNDYFINFNNSFVALKHNVISTVPHREVHGGITPEEVMIPMIHIINSDNTKTINYQIEIVNPKVAFSKRELDVRINPKPLSSPFLWINDKKIVSIDKSGKYRFSLDGIDSGKYPIKFEINEVTYSDKIEILSGFYEEDLFDE